MQNRTYISGVSGTSCEWCQWRYEDNRLHPTIPPKVSHYWLPRQNGMWRTSRCLWFKTSAMVYLRNK